MDPSFFELPTSYLIYLTGPLSRIAQLRKRDWRNSDSVKGTLDRPHRRNGRLRQTATTHGTPMWFSRSYLVRAAHSKPEVANFSMVGFFVESDTYKAYVKSRTGGGATKCERKRSRSAHRLFLSPHRCAFATLFTSERNRFRLISAEVWISSEPKLRAARDLLLPRLMSGRSTV